MINEKNDGQAHSTDPLSRAIAHMAKQKLPINLERLLAVREAITNGCYPVDSKKIAQKILELDNAKVKSS